MHFKAADSVEVEVEEVEVEVEFREEGEEEVRRGEEVEVEGGGEVEVVEDVAIIVDVLGLLHGLHAITGTSSDTRARVGESKIDRVFLPWFLDRTFFF